MSVQYELILGLDFLLTIHDQEVLADITSSDEKYSYPLYSELGSIQNSDFALRELSCVPFRSPLVAPDPPDLSLQKILRTLPLNFSAANR